LAEKEFSKCWLFLTKQAALGESRLWRHNIKNFLSSLALGIRGTLSPFIFIYIIKETYFTLTFVL